MTERFRKLRAAFDAAMAEPDPVAREHLVVAACGEDADLLRDLQAMLAALVAHESHRDAANRVEAQFRKAMMVAFKSPMRILPFDVHKFERTLATFRLVPNGAWHTRWRHSLRLRRGRVVVPALPSALGVLGTHAVHLRRRVGLLQCELLGPQRTEACRLLVAGARAERVDFRDPRSMAQFHGALHTPALARVFGDIVDVALRDEARPLTTIPLSPEFS